MRRGRLGSPGCGRRRRPVYQLRVASTRHACGHSGAGAARTALCRRPLHATPNGHRKTAVERLGQGQATERAGTATACRWKGPLICDSRMTATGPTRRSTRCGVQAARDKAGQLLQELHASVLSDSYGVAPLPCPSREWLTKAVDVWLECEGLESPGRAEALANHVLNNWAMVSGAAYVGYEQGECPKAPAPA